MTIDPFHLGQLSPYLRILIHFTRQTILTQTEFLNREHTLQFSPEHEFVVHFQTIEIKTNNLV